MLAWGRRGTARGVDEASPVDDKIDSYPDKYAYSENFMMSSSMENRAAVVERVYQSREPASRSRLKG